MELKIICQDKTLEGCLELAEAFIGEGRLRAIPCKLSMFEQYEIRSDEHKWIKECYKYRIVHKGDYTFGKLI